MFMVCFCVDSGDSLYIVKLEYVKLVQHKYWTFQYWLIKRVHMLHIISSRVNLVIALTKTNISFQTVLQSYSKIIHCLFSITWLCWIVRPFFIDALWQDQDKPFSDLIAEMFVSVGYICTLFVAQLSIPVSVIGLSWSESHRHLLNTSSQTSFQLKDLLTELQSKLDGSYTEAVRQNEELNLVSVAPPLARAPFKTCPYCTQQCFYGGCHKTVSSVFDRTVDHHPQPQWACLTQHNSFSLHH